MRIGTDGKHSHREDSVDQVIEFYGRNRTESRMRAADDVPNLVRSIYRAIEGDDLTGAQRRELAEALSTRYFDFEFSLENGEIVATVRPE